MTEHFITLSTTEPNNYVGLIKLRQGDKDSQVLNVTVTENGKLFKFDGLAVFFNSVLPNGTVVRDKVQTIDYANSKLTYKVIDSFLQEVAAISAWFSFESGDKTVDSTKNFRYIVESGWKSCITQGNYIYELSEIQREIEEIISNKDFTSLISKISSLETDVKYLDARLENSNAELIASRNGKSNLKTRIDDLENETTTQLAQTVNKGEGGVITPAMLSQETKKQMTGGSVAVVGIDSVLTKNLVDKQVTPEKTTFINNKLNFTLERGTILSGVNDNTISTRRVRSTSIVKHTDGIYIVRKDANYLIGAVTYKNGIFDGIDRGWIDRDVIELQGKNELRINVRRRDDAAIADNELATIAAGIEIKHNFQSADAKDVERAVQDITAIKGSIAQTISLKSEEFEMGTINENIPLDHTKRARMKNMLRVSKGDIIKFQKDPTIVNYGISISDLNGVWRGVDYGWLNQPEFIIEEDSFIQLTVRYVDNRDLDANALKMLTENTFNITYSPRSIVNTIKKNTAIGSISVEYGRIEGASYVFARIPKTLNDGSRFVPKVALTSGDGSLSGAKRSALNYARDQDTIFTLNAGLFNVTTVEPVGQLIIDGVSLINTLMTSDNGVPIHPDECYPLAIDGNGNLKTYPRNADTAAMIADGVKYAVTAWGKLVDNFKITTKDIDNEIVHNGKYIRQSIGQYQNGDYCVCSVDMTRGPVTNEAGLYYEELAQLFVDKGVEFAYSLDGGGSTQTVIGKRQLNPIYEGSAGRAVPTVITFEIVN
ncbi:BppU family phage baseplate upper protein [Lactococcus cremoris]|uniref:BppU family phage baseplate upper protein n=1 Tax=Lactococcus lactis subsp. cremoris TaxID=1359 RepID=UPI0007B21AEF|nr:BppU family phage baseplate upper protein [Lactococcus cremoris]KZK08962.1 Phage capsid and scaffold [Lactococcus cremoris]MDU8932525.1 hypothetical protein [Lactococcus cremoris]